MTVQKLLETLTDEEIKEAAKVKAPLHTISGTNIVLDNTSRRNRSTVLRSNNC